MMKNKKLKIFVYLSVLLGFLVSCRTDFINEQIVKKNNTSSLTTKRISLKESPHRQRLTPLLSELNKNLNNGYNSQKSVNFGDSIIVDTDDIIMMENGTNFHTYTFKVKRTNAKPNDPVENIVLSPLSDGKYLELYVVYNLSENEKKKILEGKFVDTKNKKQITKIINGNFSNALLSKSGMLDCGWVDTGAFVTECSDGVHGMWNQDKWNECVANSKPGWHWTMTYHCDYIQDVNENNGHNGIGNNGNTGGGAFPCPDCPAPEPCVQVPTSPTPSTTITDENGCVVGLPTTPNMGIEATPCKKIKNTINKPQIKDTIASYKTFAQVSKKKEKGFMEYTNGTLISGQVSKDLSVTHVYGFTSVGTIHVHPLESIAIFSPKDLLNFITLLKYQNPTSIKNAYAGMISSTGNYYINFSGTASDLPPDLTQQEYVIYIQDLYNKYYAIFNNIRKSENKPMGNNLSQQGREKLFFEMMKHMGLKGKINLVKEENGTLYNISEGLNGNPPTSTPCN